jgi:di/tricarboxylate transporter
LVSCAGSFHLPLVVPPPLLKSVWISVFFSEALTSGTNNLIEKVAGEHMGSIRSVVFLVVGIILLIWGLYEMESFSSDISRIFTGTPTDKAIWLLIGGTVLSILGIAGILKGRKGYGR